MTLSLHNSQQKRTWMPDAGPKSSVERVRAAAIAAGLDIEIVEMPGSTRTAEDAAAACGCSVGEIVKSLVFRGTTSDEPVLLLVSGANRVDERAVAATIGEKLGRADADWVRLVTGFAIGGVSPLGHTAPVRTFMDQDLLGYARVWAAAGSPRSVFAVTPDALKAATSAEIIAMS